MRNIDNRKQQLTDSCMEWPTVTKTAESIIYLKSADGGGGHALNDRYIGGEQSNETFVYVEREARIGLTEAVQ